MIMVRLYDMKVMSMHVHKSVYSLLDDLKIDVLVKKMGMICLAHYLRLNFNHKYLLQTASCTDVKMNVYT